MYIYIKCYTGFINALESPTASQSLANKNKNVRKHYFNKPEMKLIKSSSNSIFLEACLHSLGENIDTSNDYSNLLCLTMLFGWPIRTSTVLQVGSQFDVSLFSKCLEYASHHPWVQYLINNEEGNSLTKLLKIVLFNQMISNKIIIWFAVGSKDPTISLM